MKTRIISGIVMGVIVAAVLAAGYLWNSVIITVAVALIAAVAVYELLHNAAGIKSKAAWLGAAVFVFLRIIATSKELFYMIFGLLPGGSTAHYSEWSSETAQCLNNFSFIWSNIYSGLLVAFVIYSVILVLKNHSDFGLAQIAVLCGMPYLLITMFSSLNDVIISKNGIYYLLLLLNFSSVCDMGAYFTGVTIGKHKLCPNISPKKTIEGAVGGIVSSIIVTVILSLCFDKAIILPVILTIPFCILGMVGDLFASAIKRSVDLKDYGSLIPGHGGILDRVDSIIMIAPLLYFCIGLGVI